MVSGGSGSFFGILAIINPPAALQAVTFGAAAHELPHAAGAGSGDGQRVESRLGLGKVDQFLGNAFFLQGAADHVFVSPGAGQCAFQGAASAVGVVIDVAGDLVGHHQRQARTGGFYLGLGFCFDVLVDGGGEFVGFVDGRRFRLLLGKAVALLEGG